MIEFSVAEWLQTLPRRGDGTVGGPSPTKAKPPASARESAPDDTPREGGDGDTVEISPQGRRLQVETQVRSAVLAELRLLAQRAAAPPPEQ